MAYFLDTFMDRMRNKWLRSVHSVEVQANGAWHRGEINLKEIDGDALVIKATFPTLDSVACTITASQIIDVHGEVAAYQTRSIQKISGQGTMIKLTVPIYEVTP